MKAHNGEEIDICGGYSIIDCVECGFKHIVPIPTKEDLDRAYREEFYGSEKPLYIESQMVDMEWLNVTYDDRLDTFEEALPKGARRLLDVGCGAGLFLKRGMDRGWSVMGVEPSRQAAEHAGKFGVEVLNCFFEDAKLDKGSFNAVHMAETMEHVVDPLAICRIVFDLLEDGGAFCVTTANDYNPLQALLREKSGFRPYWLTPPEHINYFDIGSLAGLLKKAGFRILKKDASFPMEVFLLMGDNYVGNNELGRLCHGKRKRFEVALSKSSLSGFRRDLYRFLSGYGIGREAIVYGVKG